jgi:hypothetical protein
VRAPVLQKKIGKEGDAEKMDHQRTYYRTSDGSMTLDFVFWNCGPEIGWRAYIIGDIDYGNRNASAHATHRNHFANDTYECICWSGKVDTFEEMKAIAALWSDATALYVKDGGNFNAIAKRLSNERNGG